MLEKTIKVYAANCCKKGWGWYKSKQTVIRKRDSCIFNKNNKACMICKNCDIIKAPSGSVFYLCEYKDDPSIKRYCDDHVHNVSRDENGRYDFIQIDEKMLEEKTFLEMRITDFSVNYYLLETDMGKAVAPKRMFQDMQIGTDTFNGFFYMGYFFITEEIPPKNYIDEVHFKEII